VAGVASALALTGAAQPAACALTPTPASALTPSPAETALLTALNEVRIAHGLLPLRADGRLTRAARGHSAKMICTDRFFHGAFARRIRRVGVRAPRVGENLAWGTGSLARARAIVSTWLTSPPHRANLLHPGYRMIGVGAVRGSFNGHRGALVITTDFAGR
jgi:uncharacterized protein YkwD